MTGDPRRTFSAISRLNARQRPDAVANRFEGRDTSFAAFDAHVDKAAHGLRAAGVERVAYLGKNGDHILEVYVAANRIGGIFAPINWRLAPPEIAQIIALLEPQALFVGPEFLGAVESVANDLPAGLTIIAMEAGHEEWPAYEAWRDAQADGPAEDAATTDGPAVILFTSGTTGLPKGVMLSNDNMLVPRAETIPDNLAYDHWDDDDVSLMAMPIAHIGGLGWWNIAFYNGCMSVIAREFDPHAVLGYIERDRVSKLFIVPAALQILVRAPGAEVADFSRVRQIFYGAAPMPLPLMREAIGVIGCEFAQCYGMTETTGTITMLMPEDHKPEGTPQMRSAGRPMPACEAKVIGPDGATLPPNEIGEACVKGSPVMIGYWRNPEATAAVLSEDGWVRTGDAGYIDEHGYLYIHDRIKDMIISGGENVYPAEVESALHGHPDIGDVAVIGVPDDKWGEAVKAVVTARDGRAVDEADVIAFARQRLAAFKCPKSVDVIEAMPRNASGKLLKRQLREPYWAGRERQVN